jgi:hypothetical protein
MDQINGENKYNYLIGNRTRGLGACTVYSIECPNYLNISGEGQNAKVASANGKKSGNCFSLQPPDIDNLITWQE